MPQHIHKSIMTHMICAYPNIQKSRDIYNILARYSDYIEVQFPFSDPIADGPLILNACHEVIKTNINTSDCFDAIELHISENMYNSRTLIMTYYQVIYHYWVWKFVSKAKEIWVHGIIVPDIPFDTGEWKELIDLCLKYQLEFIPVVWPSTSIKRLLKISSSVKTWLVYAVSQNMTTWNTLQLWHSFHNYIQTLRHHFPISQIAVWFWVTTWDDINHILQSADIAVLWTILLKTYIEKQAIWLEQLLEEMVSG
jgi:tryptophan synthase alpha chain